MLIAYHDQGEESINISHEIAKYMLIVGRFRRTGVIYVGIMVTALALSQFSPFSILVLYSLSFKAAAIGVTIAFLVRTTIDTACF
jgi:hypothetical protein